MMKKTIILALGTCLAMLSCTKRDETKGAMSLGSAPPINGKQSFNSWDPVDATTAYTAFNNACYNQTLLQYHA